MYGKERQDKILEIINRQGYATVKELTRAVHYSTATVNRDLNLLEVKGLIRRSYGGAESKTGGEIPLVYRYNKMKKEKRLIGKAAAELVRDGDTVFIDGSTTTEAVAHHLTEKKNITVITNNLSAVMLLSLCGIKVICLGGAVAEPPSMLGGDVTVENARHYTADIGFFSSYGVTKDGKIGIEENNPYYLLNKAIIENSERVYYIADHEKITEKCGKYLCGFSEITGVITDGSFPDLTKEKFPATEFIEVGN